MHKAIKIFVGVVVFLGIISGIFLLTAKKKTAAVEPSKTAQSKMQATPTPKKVAPAKPKAQDAQERRNLAAFQWQQCKDKTSPAQANLIWDVQIIEGIPEGGTYAKGMLNNDATLPVRVIVKPDSQNVEKIKSLLIVGKIQLLRGNCADVAPDGAVVFQAF